jgi:hypothetical protein
MNDDGDALYVLIPDPRFAGRETQKVTGIPAEHLSPTTPPRPASAPAAALPMPTSQTIRDAVTIGDVTLKQTVFGLTSYTIGTGPEVRLSRDVDAWVRGLIKALKAAA